MKTKIIFLSALFIITFNESNAQQTGTKKTNVESDGYKNKVKQVNQSCYVAIDQSGKIVQGNRIGPDRENFLSKYNEKGSKIEEFTYNVDGSLYSSVSCKYDDHGNQLEMNGFNSQNEENSKNYKIIWKYDEKGNEIEVSNFKSDGSLYNKNIYTYNYDEKGIKTRLYDTGVSYGYFITTYNQAGNKTEVNHYNKNKKLRFKYTYKYDESGNEIEYIKYNSKLTVLLKFTYKYDTKANQTEWCEYKPNGSIKNRDVITFDENDNLVQEYFYNGTGKLIDKHSWKYEYDSQGNWIKKIKFKDNKPVSISIRQIEYYN